MNIVGIYCRLSDEDHDKEDPAQDSKSIQNQKSMLIQYAIKNEWNIYKIYCDDDYSGINQNRPQFNELLKDAEDKKIDIILCKTQSRFTRDMEMVEKYIHHKFVEWGIRFVTCVDGVDTNVKGGKKSRQINGLVNEWYIEDLSDNVRAVFDNKRKSGKFIGSYAPYGYIKDPKDHNRLIVDPEAAETVKQIFNMRLNGYGFVAIARHLNEQFYPNPTDYRILKGYEVKTIPPSPTQHLWKDYTVRQILTREAYIGNMVQGISKKISYKSDKVKRVPKSEWIKVSNTHEPIVDEETFRQVQSILASYCRPIKKEGKSHVLAGKVKCEDCGATMQMLKSKEIKYLRCKSNVKFKGICENTSVRFVDVEQEIIKQIKILINSFVSKDIIESGIGKNDNIDNKLAMLECEVKKDKEKVEKISATIFSLYTDKINGVINEEQFVEMNNHFNKEKSDIKQKMECIKTQHSQILETKQKLSSKCDIVSKYLNMNTLTQTCVNELIDYVTVKSIGKKRTHNKDIKINIYWKI